MAEGGLTKQTIIAELTRSPHGKLEDYLPTGRRARREQADFYAHLVAWNHEKGQVRDAKLALPLISLMPSTLIAREDGFLTAEVEENALAHLALLDPRTLLRGLEWARAKHVVTNRGNRKLNELVTRYLRVREERWGWWERTAVQHRASMKSLYCFAHVKPSAMAELILFKGSYPKGTIFDAIRTLKDMTPREAAGTIMEKKIPFLVALGALGKMAKDVDLALALMERMTATELVTNSKMLERLGVKTIPALRAAYEQGLAKVAGSKKGVFKTTRAADAMTDEGMKQKLKGAQEKQLTAMSVDGDWLVLGDKSGSMQNAIAAAQIVAGTLARMVKGRVHLTFFDVLPYYAEVTGMEYDAILEKCRKIRAEGGTSIGVGLHQALEKGLELDGIAIVSDGSENTSPVFAPTYERYCKKFDREPSVYLYKVASMENTGTFEYMMETSGHTFQKFDLPVGFDYHSLPNLVQTMRVGRYSLVDEIMATPLKNLKEVFAARDRDTITA